MFAQSSRGGGLNIKVVSPVVLAEAMEVHLPLSPIPKDDPSSYRGKWRSMRLNGYDFSKWFDVTVDDSKILRFYEKPDATSKEIGKVKLSSTSGKQLLFFMGNYETQKYRVFALKNSEVNWGEYGVFNSTRSPLMFELGKSKKVAKPQAVTVLVPSTEVFSVKAYTQYEGKVKQVQGTKWRLKKNEREFIFCIQRPNTFRVKWLHVRDYKYNDSLQKS